MTDATDQTIRLEYDGEHVPFAKIVLVNAIYQLLTAMIFRFWARTRERKFLWSHVKVGDDRLEYTGTGLELFLGFLIVMAVVLFPIVGGMTFLAVMLGDDPKAFAIIQVGYMLLIVFLMHMAIYRARRYRLTRTLWRGIRGTLTGSSARYALAALGYTFLTMITLGLAAPVMRIGLVRREIENMHFGNRPFTFHGRASELFRIWILPWISLPLLIGALIATGAYGGPTFDPEAMAEGKGPQFGGGAMAALMFGYLIVILAMSWYRVVEFRYLAGSVGFEGLRFSSNLRFARVFWIYLSSYLLMLVLVVLFFMAIMAVVVGLVGVETLTAVSEGDISPDFIVTELGEERIGALFMLAIFIISVGAHVLNRVMVFHRMARTVVTSLAITGAQDFSQVSQALDEAPKVGEGLADAFDLGDF